MVGWSIPENKQFSDGIEEDQSEKNISERREKK
jgi:hypothetical protein